ncbi:MAG: hypothetical protein IJU28_06255 [Clostridia bacterium]|nr:hypothetical protein [Clostridia bacterium]
MKEWDMNVVISILLGIMGMFAVLGWVAISMSSGTSSGTEVPLSIASGLSGVLTGKGIAEAKFKKESQPPSSLEEKLSGSIAKEEKQNEKN